MSNIPTPQATPQKVLDLWYVLPTEGTFTKADVAHLLGYVGRQGDYYTNALLRLEVIELSGKLRYALKNDFKNLTDLERAQIFYQKVNDKKFHNEVLVDFKKVKDKTIERREKDYAKWRNFKVAEYKRNIAGTINPETICGNADYSLPVVRQGNEKITITTLKDKSSIHEGMKRNIIEYAKKFNIHIEQEKMGADLISYDLKTNVYKIIEIKSYKNGLHAAIGQLMHYRYKFQDTLYRDFKDTKFEILYVGVADYDSNILDMMKSLNIKYIKLSDASIKDII